MTIIHSGRHIIIPALTGLRVAPPRRTSAAGGWWTVAGQTCVVAYAPKGAASYAASKSNLANPGTYDAAEGIAPDWAAMTGDAYARLGAPAGASVSADVAAVKAQTDDIGAAGAGLTAIPNRIVEGTLDDIEVLRILLAALAGKASGGGTTTIKFRDQADTKDRITATVDSSGNRSIIVVDAS